MSFFGKAKVVLAVLVMCLAQQGTAQRYKNLALEGGSIRGIAYAGAVQILA